MAAVGSSTDGNYAVRVCSGRHSGAEIALTAGAYVVGAGSDADIVLTDEGILPSHVEIRLDSGFCRVWSLDGAVKVEDHHLNPGAKTVVQLPAEFQAAGVTVKLRPVAPAARTRKPHWRARVAFGLVGMALLGGGAILSGSLPAFGTPTLGSGSADSEHVVAVPRAAEAPAATAEATGGHKDAAAATAALKGRLNAVGLGGAITVQANGNIIEASGVILPEQSSEWTSVQVWLDGTYKGWFPLVNKVKAAAGGSKPQLTIQAIWAGPGPYVIAADGEKYGPGATLPGGWQIETIASQQVVVSRSGERVSLTP